MPTGCFMGYDTSAPMVKRVVVLPDPPPDDLVGQRIALATDCTTPLNRQQHGDWSAQYDGSYGNYWLVHKEPGLRYPLPLGVIVGSATVEAILPIGHHALVLTDAAPTTERCPRCWRSGYWDDSESKLDPRFNTVCDKDAEACPRCSRFAGYDVRCSLICSHCDGAGRCDPILWTSPGGTGLGEWTP